MRNVSLAFCFTIAAALPAAAADPAVELSRGRAALEQRDYAAALEAFEAGISGTDAIADQAIRTQALAALHFYAALAAHQKTDEAAAKNHLESFFEYNPNATRADPKKYDAEFVTLFNQVRTAPKGGATVSFDSLYPNWEVISKRPVEPFIGFASTPEFAFLATSSERNEFLGRSDTATGDRLRDEFWKRRDPTPGTERNEYREAFMARIAFADYYFTSGDARGSLTDRGRVFLLLGKPGAVESRGFRPSDGRLTIRETIEFGDATLEIWKYPRKLLPVAIPTAGVSYLFVSHQRLGDHVMHDLAGMPLRALLAAADRPIRD